MKVEFEVKGLKWSIDAELPAPVIEVISAVAAELKADLPATVKSLTAKLRDEWDRSH